MYWTYVPGDEGTDVANIISTNDVFSNNIAQYGTELATQGVMINSSSVVLNVEEYNVFLQVSASVLDYYGNTVVGVVEGSKKLKFSLEIFVDTSYVGCDAFASGVTSGQVSVTTTTGVGSFDAFQLKCMPDGDLSLDFFLGSSSDAAAALDGSYFPFINTSHIPSVQSYIDVYFRACVAGEYYANGECIVCETGTYSLGLDANDYQDTLCVAAPPNSNSSSTFGNNIYAVEGFWRVSDLAHTLIACPYGAAACRPGTTVGDNSCGVGFEGALCGVCSADYFFDADTLLCQSCAGQNTIPVLQLGLMILGGIILLIVVSTRFETSMLFDYESFDTTAMLDATQRTMRLKKDADVERGNESSNSELRLVNAIVPSESSPNEANFDVDNDESEAIGEKQKKTGSGAGAGSNGGSEGSENGSKNEEESQYGLADSLMAKGKILISVYQVSFLLHTSVENLCNYVTIRILLYI